MAEPEDVITEAAHAGTVAVRALWSRWSGPDDRLRLADLRHRLRLLLAALFPTPLEIGVAEPPAPRWFLARWAAGTPPHSSAPLSSTDGRWVRLPAEVPGDDAAVRARYRLLALEQAARAERGTPAHLPADRLTRDLYLLAEAAAVDRELAESLPRLEPEIARARREARGGRPAARRPPAQREMERLVCALLEAAPAAPPPEVPGPVTPREALGWAENTAVRIRARGGRYRGVAPVELWGAPDPAADALPDAAESGDLPASARPRTGTMPRRPRVRRAEPDEDDASPGMWLPRADDPKESVEDPVGLQRPADREEQGRPGDLGDSLSELPEARLVRDPRPPREVLASDRPVPRSVTTAGPSGGPSALVYPEWDWKAGRYRPHGAVVREQPHEEGTGEWSERTLEKRAAVVRRLRREFERLRPRRRTLRNQSDGADPDLDACVTAAADRLAGSATDARLYLDERRLGRDSAVLLLVDGSASTDAWLVGARRVIDLEKEALLIVAEALAALGERHAVAAFRSQGPGRVDLLMLKRFEEGPGRRVRRRIGALEPDGYTRLGAALRHGTALLARERARHRLLLLLSDGRPNDVDLYEGRYGLEDTRRAVAEARMQDVRLFCLTIDREAPQYASHVFGARGYALLRRPDRLPDVFVAVLRRLLLAWT